MAQTVDFRARYLNLFKVAFVALLIGVTAWLIVRVGQGVADESQLIGCRNKLKELGAGLQQYYDNNGNRLPQWLTQLYPSYVDSLDAFICPNDDSEGENGCWPDWLTKDPDWHSELRFADLDGPTLRWRSDADTVPCSYFYRFNYYPIDQDDDWSRVWQQIGEDEVKQYARHGNVVPIVQCFWHLKEGTPDNAGAVPSLLRDMIQTTIYPRKWKTALKDLSSSR